MSSTCSLKWIGVVVGLAAGLAGPPAGAQPQALTRPLVGVKIYEYKKDLPALFSAWERLGVNTAFVSPELAGNKAFMAMARLRHVAVFIIVPTFFNPERLAQDPDLYAIDGHGQRAKSEWVEFVCPTRPAYRAERVAYVQKLIRDCQPDGISIDFIRFFVFWEKVYPDAALDPLRNTCFCAHCLAAFQKEAGVRLPEDLKEVSAQAGWILAHHAREFTDWKCGVISSMVRDMAAAARAAKPGILLNVHLVPWRQVDFGGGLRTVVGQDVAAIAQHVDYLSPMCYAHMLKRPASWIQSVVADVQAQARNPVIPSIEVKEDYVEKPLDLSIFAGVLGEAVKPPAQGVVFWFWDPLEASREKQDAVRVGVAGLGLAGGRQ